MWAPCTFQASHFRDVASNWGIAFSIWKNGETMGKNNFVHDLVDYIDGEVKIIGSKNIYNLDNNVSASDWAKESIKKLPTRPHVPMCSGITWCSDCANNRGTIFDNALGYFYNACNNVEQSAQGVAMFSATFGNGHGLNESNFTRCTALFTARKLFCVNNWVINKDEYIAPNESHPRYKEYENDSIIYSLFQSNNNATTLRQITCRGN